MLVKTEGIVIRTRDYGEGNKIVTIFSERIGKHSVMARGAKKTKSRLSSVCQLFTYGHFLVQKGTNINSMGSLSQGEIIHSFRELRADLNKTAYAAYFAELVDKSLEDGERNPFLFQLLHTAFQFLEEEKDAEIVSRIFEIQVLTISGYRPALEHCSRCQITEGEFRFSVREGGLLCQNCLSFDPESLKLKNASLKLLRTFYLMDLQRLGNVNVQEETKQELKKAIWLFMDVHTPLRLRSRSFLEQMEKYFPQ